MQAERRKCPECGHHWAWLMSDGRFKCRWCAHRYRCCSVWRASRLGEADKRKLLEYFVLGVPAYRARFRVSCSLSSAVFAPHNRAVLSSDSRGDGDP